MKGRWFQFTKLVKFIPKGLDQTERAKRWSTVHCHSPSFSYFQAYYHETTLAKFQPEQMARN